MNLSLNPPLRHWQGRRVWIVGASSGIGRATASLLHARGAQVIVSARNAQALQDFVATHPGSQALALDGHFAIEQAPANGHHGHQIGDAAGPHGRGALEQGVP